MKIDDTYIQVEKLYNTGMKSDTIAKWLNISQQKVKNIIEEIDIRELSRKISEIACDETEN